MSRLCANADGNASGSIWGLCDSASELDSEATSVALTASDQSSSTFTPAAVAIDAILVKVASRASGSPTNTITITLRNNTGASDVASVTINVSDIQACDTSDRQGGWYLFKLGSTHTPNGTDTYLIKAKLSATTTAVSLWVSATTNFSRILRTTTTQAPAASDRMIVTKEWTAAATGTARSVTWDITATTNYGSSTGLSTSTFTTGGAVNAAIVVGNGGTLTWGTTAATNYYMKLTGPVIVYSNGTWIRGSSGTPIPSDSTAVLEFAMATNQDSGFGRMTGCICTEEGLPRTVANNTVWCLLNTDEAAGQTVLGVDTDTGWKNGDSIVIASTTQTQSQAEVRTLSADAGASSLTVSSGLTNAHGGSAANGIQAEVILLTRNVVTRSDNASRVFKETIGNCTITMRWVWSKYSGGCTVGTTTTTFTAEYCSYDLFTSSPLAASSPTTAIFTWRHNVFYTTSATSAPNISSLTTTNWAITDCVGIFTNGGGCAIGTTGTGMGEVHDLRYTGVVQINMTSATQSVGSDFGNIVVHANGGLTLSGLFNNRTISGINIWRCNLTGLTVSGPNTSYADNIVFNAPILFGNATRNILIDTTFAGEVTFLSPTIAGDTTFATTTGMYLQETSSILHAKVNIIGGTFGVASGTKTTHTTDIQIGGNTTFGKHMFVNIVNTTLASATEVGLGTALKQPSGYSWQRPDGALAGTKTFIAGQGTVTYETSTVQAATAAQKLTPAQANNGTLRSGRKRVAVDSGVTVTMSVYARKDGSYNGTIEPRLVVLANPAVGITSDTVLDTLSVGANTWEQLSGTTGTTTDKGVLEFVVECNGTAGNAFCDTWAAS